jgi:hypothetical protein
MLPSGLPELIGNEEDLARFLTQSSHFSSFGAKPSAFLPNPNDRETSVSRHGDNPEDRLWQLGAVAAGGRNLHAVAILKSASVLEADLTSTSDEPPDRHAVIGGWPWNDEDPEMQKAMQKKRAVVLASKSKVVLKPH